uniref:Uncharacterized protein n=1 Tax=Human herpesvirus 2 TaxID=10310 RepID=A0A481TQS4_HHV2|nr:hypothetical protein [Human alphaherpesvirus 2]
MSRDAPTMPVWPSMRTPHACTFSSARSPGW